MKTLFLVLTGAFLLFNSCEKEPETNLVTIYVGNSGTAGIWTYVTVTINGKSETFMTPEGSNKTINDCNRNNSNACFFDLYPGTYSYHATDGVAVWDGSITVGENECPILELSY